MMKMRAAVLAVLLTGAASVGLVGANPASAGPGRAPAGAVTPHVPCPDNGWSAFDQGHFGTFVATDVRIRSGPGLDCAIRGVGQPGHSLQYHCWKGGTDGFTWTHLIDFSVHDASGRPIQGWSRDMFLSDVGATAHC
jgi:hypothetical protein